jgi:hypothetical protein
LLVRTHGRCAATSFLSSPWAISSSPHVSSFSLYSSFDSLILRLRGSIIPWRLFSSSVSSQLCTRSLFSRLSPPFRPVHPSHFLRCHLTSFFSLFYILLFPSLFGLGAKLAQSRCSARPDAHSPIPCFSALSLAISASRQAGLGLTTVLFDLYMTRMDSWTATSLHLCI